jgi:hypothetical protein
MGIGKPNDGPWWASTCALLVLPLTAIAHNAVFYPNQCMLEAFAVNQGMQEPGGRIDRRESESHSL